jgi:M6 family metalloprotease-like protein
MVRKVLLKKLFIFLLIIAFWTSLNIAPITANIEAGDAVGSGSSSIGYGDLVGPNLDDLGFPSPSGNRESAGVNTMLGVLVDDVEGPDVPSPPKHYKTLDIMLAEAGLGEEVKGPPPVPVSGTRELLVILAELSDATHDASHSVAYFDDRFFDTATPSVRDYFDEVSYGAFTYVPGEVRGWYLSTSTKAQYTANPYNVFAEAIQDVDPFFNFATYDTDSNGVVENEELTIFFIVSGDAGGAAHGRNYPNVATADGVSVEGEYSRTNEFRHMGSYCHELGHDLGLPDLYDVNGGSEGIGNYGLMGGGSWTFSHMTAWSKIQLGWITPTIVTANGYYDIDDAETTADAYILMDPDRTNEYFVIENRFPSNSYYETRPVGDPEAPSGPLPDEGIVIYHVDETKMQDWITSGINNVNDDEAHKGVDVECADFPTSHVVNADHLDQSVNRGDEFDLWSNDEYDFTDDSDPCSAIWYDGSDSGMAVRDLPPSAPTMRVFLSISNARKAGKIGIIQTHGDLLGSYAALADYYMSLGYSVEDITTQITLGKLQAYDMVVVGERGSAWLPSEIAAVQDYIASGGGFVAIGDQLTSSVLDILGAYGISYTGVGGSVGPSNNFDSLHPIMRDVLYINAPAPINSLQVAAPAYWIANDNGDTHIIIAGAEDGGRVLCLSDDFLSAYENTFFLNQNDVMFKNIADWVCTHQVCLYDDDSYDFSKQIRSEYSGGDFYYYATTLPGEFFANNVGQNGVQDLGDVGSVKLDEVAIPSTGYTRFGVEAIEGHTYVSLAQDGEEGMYIVFKVVKLKADYSCVKIEYLYRSTRSLEKAYLVVRGSNDNIYYLTYDVQAETWNTWTNAPGSTPNSPAATVINNELHLAVRGSSGDKIWHGYVNLDDNSFSGWTLLSTEDSGLTYDAPALTSNSTHACLVIRARNSCIFYRFYEVATRTWGDWIMVPAGTTSTTPAAVLAGDELHLAVRGSSSPLIWHGAVDLGTGGFSGWTQLDGTTPSPPVLTSNSTHLCLVIRGSNNAIYYRWYDLAAESWGGWTSFPFGLTPDVPAATITGDSLQIVVRGMVDDLIWHGTLDLTSDTWSGWSQLEGSTPSKPVLTS